ncbi:ribosomal protein S18 acetylase RimI-like enzyme [Halarchaeum rubridurum]|uniref:GNAT family N-acetyltransferase n=1 Tax=Halarchaeum rubridurum TaxID=489911 RepID=A0A830FZ42_9EURY|nr:GNAT family N-acetyltransferase [Halarchaeum rubridurum]MBP1953550.1 ribosomal protein S18 acetylase RimI-like enzyme [Halarchaeum rubridurum]GGM64432.1 GNAT family N-acetyltransferase [Halarchaeum rubridurum]
MARRAPDGVRIEAATMDDLDALVDRWVALVADQRDYGTHLLAAENRTTARDVLSQYVATDRVFVARPAGTETPVGFVMFHPESGLYDEDVTRGVVDNVYVDPAYRERGIGSALLDAAEDALSEADVDVLSIAVMADNERARALYEERGYRPQRHVLEKPRESDTHTKEGDER